MHDFGLPKISNRTTDQGLLVYEPKEVRRTESVVTLLSGRTPTQVAKHALPPYPQHYPFISVLIYSCLLEYVHIFTFLQNTCGFQLALMKFVKTYKNMLRKNKNPFT